MQGEDLAEKKRKNVSGAVGVTHLRAWKVEEDESFLPGLAHPRRGEKPVYPKKEVAFRKALVAKKACTAPWDTRENKTLVIGSKGNWHPGTLTI